MFAINAGEWALLVVWLVGVAAAIYAAGEINSTVRRVALVLVAALIPVLGSLVGIGFGVARLRRSHSGTNATAA